MVVRGCSSVFPLHAHARMTANGSPAASNTSHCNDCLRLMAGPEHGSHANGAFAAVFDPKQSHTSLCKT